MEKVTKLDFTFETREKMIRRDAKAEGRNETIEELQPRIDVLTADIDRLSADNKTLTEENSALTEELAKYKAAFGDLNTTDAGAD